MVTISLSFYSLTVICQQQLISTITNSSKLTVCNIIDEFFQLCLPQVCVVIILRTSNHDFKLSLRFNRECEIGILTPFLPGMPHSQFMRFNVPSAALVGRATNPCTSKHTTHRTTTLLTRISQAHQNRVHGVQNHWT